MAWLEPRIQSSFFGDDFPLLTAAVLLGALTDDGAEQPWEGCEVEMAGLVRGLTARALAVS